MFRGGIPVVFRVQRKMGRKTHDDFKIKIRENLEEGSPKNFSAYVSLDLFFTSKSILLRSEIGASLRAKYKGRRFINFLGLI